MGPTASGKTELAMALAQLFPIDLISVDSTQIYKDLNIGSGKPAPDVLKKNPHHLIDILTPIQVYSVAKFVEDTHKLIEKSFEKGKIPLLVGGTMMYFHALQNGLHQLPASEPTIRAALEEEGKICGLAFLHQRLQEIDPESAQRIHVGDKQRILRALEVYYVTGISLSAYFYQQKKKSVFNFINVALIPKETPRKILHERINGRFLSMLKDGLVDEVINLREKYALHPDLPSMRSVGYRQTWAYLEQLIDFETLQMQAMAATRQLAKRQLTWLRSWPELQTIDLLDKDKINIMKKVCEGAF